MAAAPPTVTPLSSVRETAAAVPVKYPVGTGQATSDPDTLAAYKEQQTAAHDVAAAKTSDAYDQWADKNIPRLIPDPDNSQDVSRIQDLQSSIDSGKRNLQQAPLTKDEENLFLRTALSGTRPDDVRDHPIAAAVAHSVQKNLSQLSRVDQLALMAAMPEEGILGMITKLAFGGQMAAGVIQQVPAAMQAYKEGDHAKAAGLATDVLINSAFLAMMAKHEVGSRQAPAIDPNAAANYRAAMAAASAKHAAGGEPVAPAEATPEPTAKPEEEKPVLHASNDVEELRASAERQAGKIGDAATAATENVPGAKVEAVRDAKDSDRIADKAERQDVQPSQIADIAAAKITVPDQAAAEQVLQNLHEQMPVESVNGNVTGEPGKNGVRQVQAVVNTQTPGEPVQRAEILIQTPEMSEAAGDTHDDYRKSQELRAAGKDDEADALEARIMREHEAADSAAQQRIGAPSDNSAP
ncbi:MAG: hypothetical protein HIU89_18445, partial [Proteobacteria bacterium]|nr:hypothetical protein [Pseudomonadota bacterium]